MENKKKILAVISSDIFYRNFINTDTFKDIADKYSVEVVLADGLQNKTIDKEYLSFYGMVTYPERRSSLRAMLMYVSMWAHRKLSATFSLKFNADTSFKRKILYRFLALPLIRQIFFSWAEFILGTDTAIDQLIGAASPDLIMLPSSGMGGAITTDFLKSAQKMKIPTFMLINGWDNLSSKGKMFYKPDIIGVWGEQNRIHANEIHDIPHESIAILGVPHFEKYYMNTDINVEEFKQYLGVPLDKPLVLLGGCSRPINEIKLLDLLEEAVENGVLPDVHVLYRPHPWRHFTKGEDNFFSRAYQHITFDPQLKDSYVLAKTKGISPDPNNILPDINYYPKLFKSVQVVISPLSTILIESALNSKPALALAFSSGQYTFSMEEIYKCTHFRYLDDCKGILVCKQSDQFIDYCCKLLAITENGDVESILEKDMKNIVYRDKETYSQRLEAYVDQYLSRVN